MKRHSRGVAIALVTLLAVVMITMLASLVVVVKNQAFFGKTEHDKVVARYAARAAVARALDELAANPQWTAGFHQERLSDVDASYTISFAGSGGPVGRTESVNNLDGPTPADGPRGPETVPPLTADLVVMVESGGLEQTVEVVVSVGPGDEGGSPYGLTASGKVAMQGNVEVDGVKDLSTEEAIPGGIHGTQVAWTPKKTGDRADVSGKVSVSGVSAGDINFGADTTLFDVKGGFQTGAPGPPPPTINIRTEIGNHRSDPAPSLVSFGVTELNDGRFYHAGDLALNGDLKLDGATLYVDGKLTLNGAISGQGALYVGGQTSFQGDSKVVSSEESGVALFSEGDVHLTGFRGTEFMDAMAASDPQVGLAWSQTKVALQDMNSLMQSHDPGELLDRYGEDEALEEMQRALGDPAGGGPTWKGMQADNLGKLIAGLQTQPESSTREFLLDKFTELRRVFGSANNQCTDCLVNDYLEGDNEKPGIFEAILEEFSDGDHSGPGGGGGWGGGGGGGGTGWKLMTEMMQLVNQVHYDKVGTAYFQGVVYTHGHVYAANEVNIIGALWANGQGGSPATVNGVQLKPGDVMLDDNVRLTLVDRSVRSFLGVGAEGGTPEIRSWMEW